MDSKVWGVAMMLPDGQLLDQLCLSLDFMHRFFFPSPGTPCQTSLPRNGNSVMFSGVIDNVAAVAEEEEADHTKIMENLMDSGLCRKEKRKMAKKMKRKQIRKEIAEKEREEEESRLNDLEEQHRLKLKEQEEADIMERQRKEFEERERLWMEKAAKLAEEEAQRKLQEEEEKAQRKQIENENDLDEDDTWEYLEDGPAEIIWQGNEIIVKKKRVRVAKKNADEQPCIEDSDRPTSNPLPPQSEAFATYKNTPAVSTQQVFDSVAQQIPNFGTEQDKAHCPFHIKTGACRFGSRCSRVHFYPDKSCTMLIKNMYNGPGLAWEQDEGLEKFISRFNSMDLLATPCILGEGGVHLFQAITSKGLNLQHTDEEVERCYEEFYEDVHTEFLKFGEIVNFKVCRNGSFHLRGNVYVHYKSLESAVLAYQSLNGRYFAGKQITCEFVGVTRWKVAICGEYMKSRLKTCSRGTACNFIHCFRNPGGDYEWADWDNPPPKYWIEKMVALFGPSDVSEYDKNMGTHSRRKLKNNKITSKFSRYPSRRSRSRSSVVDCLTSSSGGDHSDENRNHQHSHSSIHKCSSSSSSRKKRSLLDEQQRNEENSSSEDDRYRYNEKDIAVHSHGDRDRISSSSRATSSRWRKGMDYLDGHDNLKERHKSHMSRLYSHDSSRKYSSRREHSSEQIKEGNYEHMKQDENYLADSHGRYDPNSGQNSDIEQRDNSETNSYFSEHEKYRGTSPDDHKPHERFKSQVEISDMNYSKKRSRHSMRKNHRKHSNSREEKADSSDKDLSCEEKHQSSSGNVVSHDQSRKRKNILNKERTSSKTTKGGLNLEKTGEHLRNMVESPEDIHHSRRHDRSSKRERDHREKAINRDDKTSISGVNDLELRGSRKRSRSQSPIQSSSRSKKEIRHGSHGS